MTIHSLLDTRRSGGLRMVGGRMFGKEITRKLDPITFEGTADAVSEYIFKAIGNGSLHPRIRADAMTLPLLPSTDSVFQASLETVLQPGPDTVLQVARSSDFSKKKENNGIYQISLQVKAPPSATNNIYESAQLICTISSLNTEQCEVGFSFQCQLIGSGVAGWGNVNSFFSKASVYFFTAFENIMCTMVANLALQFNCAQKEENYNLAVELC